MQHELGVTGVAFDLTAACSGFVLGLITASQFIQTGARKNVLVIGADALSRYVDWNDRGASRLLLRSSASDGLMQCDHHAWTIEESPGRANSRME